MRPDRAPRAASTARAVFDARWLVALALLVGLAGPAPAAAQAALLPAFPTDSGSGAFLPLHNRSSLKVPRLQEPPRATRWRIAAQLAGGLIGAAAPGLLAWSVVDDPYGPDRRVKGDAGYTPNANTAYAAASLVGSTLAVYWIGRGDGSRGSLLATAGGAGLASALLFLGRHEPYLPLLGLVYVAPLQAVGATVGYQQTR